MINNTTVENKYTTTGDIHTVYPITFQGATDNGGLPMLKVTLVSSDESTQRDLRYNEDYILAYDETQEDNLESLNNPQVTGIILLSSEDATAGNKLTIARHTPLVQPIDFQIGRIDPEQIERIADLSVLRDQELKATIGNIVDTSEEAKQIAESAVETAEEAKDIAQDAFDATEALDTRVTQNEEDIAAIIEGGNIDGVTIQVNANNKWEVQAVKNQNTAVSATQPVYDWVGTREEYIAQDIATQHPEWLCFITNDMYDPGSTYSFEQGVAADTWRVTHNLDKYPSVTVVDSAGTTIDCTVTYINSNECELKFNAAFKGTAYLN